LENAAAGHRRPQVFFDVTHAGGLSGRVVMELFDDITPKTAENFRQICTGEHVGKEGKALHYKGTVFHRVIPDFMLQGGDITKGNGTGGDSIYGRNFPDENFAVRHTTRGLLSMANAGHNTNNSQFFLTVKATNWLDGKHTVFGRVIEGIDLVMCLNRVKTVPGDKPAQSIVIKDSGEILDEDGAVKAAEAKAKRDQEERDAGKSEMQKSHERVRVARAKVEAEAKEVVEQVSDAVAAGLKRAVPAPDVQAQKKRVKGMFAGLDASDSDGSDA